MSRFASIHIDTIVKKPDSSVSYQLELLSDWLIVDGHPISDYGDRYLKPCCCRFYDMESRMAFSRSRAKLRAKIVDRSSISTSMVNFGLELRGARDQATVVCVFFQPVSLVENEPNVNTDVASPAASSRPPPPRGGEITGFLIEFWDGRNIAISEAATEFPLDLPNITGFDLIFPRFYRVSPDLTYFYRILPTDIEFYSVSCTNFL